MHRIIAIVSIIALSACDSGGAGRDGVVEVLTSPTTSISFRWKTEPVPPDTVNVDVFLELGGDVEQTVFIGRFPAPLLDTPVTRDWWGTDDFTLQILRADERNIDVVRIDGDAGEAATAVRIAVPKGSVVQCVDNRDCD